MMKVTVEEIARELLPSMCVRYPQGMDPHNMAEWSVQAAFDVACVFVDECNKRLPVAKSVAKSSPTSSKVSKKAAGDVSTTDTP